MCFQWLSMKKLLPLLLLLLPLTASAATAVPWSITNLTDTFIFPNLINGSAKGILVSASSTINGNLSVSGLTPGQCLQATTGGLITTSGAACGSGSGGSGLSTTSPVVAGNLLYYNGSGAGSATGVATTTLSGNSQVAVSNSPVVIGASPAVLSIVADSIGDTQLAFNTGQNLTTASSPTFAALTVGTLSGVIGGNSGSLYAMSTTTVSLGLGLSGTVTSFNNVTQSLTIATSSLFSGTQGQNAIFTGTNTIMGTSTLFTTPAQAIGIGTLTPAAKVDIAGTSTASTGQVLDLWDSTGATLVRVRNDGNVGLGIINPGARLVATNQSAVQTPISGSIAQFVGTDNAPLRLTFDTHNNGSTSGTAFMFRRSRGTAASPAAVQQDDVLGSLNFRGFGATGYAAGSTALMTAKAEGVFTDTSMATSLAFDTTATTSVTAIERVRITGAGNVGFGTTTPFGKFAISLQSTDTGYPGNFAFIVASSTASATSTLFSVSNVGSTTIGRLGACSGSSGLITDVNGTITCAATTGFVTAVTGTWPIISSGGTTPNLTWGGIATSSNIAAGAAVLYATGVNTFASAATTSATINNGLTGTLTTINSQTQTIGLASIANGTVLGYVGSGTGVPTAQATSSLYGAGTGGQILAWNNGVPQWVATSSILGTTYWTSAGGNIYNNTGTNVGVGSSTPWASLSVASANSATLKPLFSVSSSSSAVATTTLFFVNGNGNVGIGTTSPEKLFMVQGAQAGGIMAVQRDVAAAVNTVYGTQLVTLNETGGTVDLTGPAQTFNIRSNGGTVNTIGDIGAIRDGADTTGTFFIRPYAVGNPLTGLFVGPFTRGMVGIGTTTPLGLLNVSNIVGGGYLYPQQVWTDMNAAADSKHFYASTTASTGNLQFGIINDARAISSITPLLTLTRPGRLNLGTTTDTAIAPLTVASSSGPQVSLSAGLSLAQWTFRNSNGGAFYIATTSVVGTATTSLAALAILNTNGNVGIGTSTPAAQLGINAVGTGVPSILVGSSTGTIFSVTPATSATIGIGTSSPWKAISFNGTGAWANLDGATSGNVPICINTTTNQIFQGSTGTNCTPSSETYKKDVRTLTTGLETIMKLRPVMFRFLENSSGSADKQENIGFIAQEVDQVDPRLVQHTDGTIMGIRQDNLLSLTVRAVQEEHNRAIALQKQVDTLEARLAALENGEKYTPPIEIEELPVDTSATSTASSSPVLGGAPVKSGFWDGVKKFFHL